ncbi:MAG: hypothetical protein IPK66_07650 [Rhodospirillales bacterium]|nr:hypothetical protein [Rhodospirillales bacterium]
MLFHLRVVPEGVPRGLSLSRLLRLEKPGSHALGLAMENAPASGLGIATVYAPGAILQLNGSVSKTVRPHR